MADKTWFSEDLCRRAEQNDSLAQWELGWCYYYGKGVKKNKREGVMWFRKAAQQYPSNDPVLQDLQEYIQWRKDETKAKLVIMIVGGIIGGVLGAIIGVNSVPVDQSTAGLAGFLCGGYFGLGIGPFTTNVILWPKVLWDIFWETPEPGNCLFTMLLSPIWLAIVLFFGPFIAIYRVASSARLNSQIFGQR